MRPPEFYLVDELAEMLRVSKMTIYRWIKSNKMTAVKVGKELRIERAEFDRLIAQSRNK